MNEIDAIRENTDDGFLSDDPIFEDRRKHHLQVMQQVQEIWREGTSINETHLTQAKEQKEDLFEELDDEYEHEYDQYVKALPETISIDLIQMNEVQKAFIYHDKYPMLNIRKRWLIAQKQFSLKMMQLTKSSIFEFITLVVIVFNSILLALDDPTTNQQSQFQDLMDIIFLALYTTEAVLKIMAYGFLFNRGAYLRDMWNILDFTVIVTAFIPYFIDNSGVNLSALRSLRVLRPLRTISSVKELRSIMMTLFASFGELSNALIVLGFSYTIFAIAGLSLFQGYAKQRCFNEFGIIQQPGTYDTDEAYCSGSCGEGFICGKMLTNPQSGLISFDNFGVAMLQVFVTTTLEGWTTIMQAVSLTFSPLSVFYFALIVIIGAFFLINLTLAIIKINFSSAENKEPEYFKEVTYSIRQLKRLGIYKDRNKNKLSIQRKQSQRITKFTPHHKPQNQQSILEPQLKPSKLRFKPMYINDFSKSIPLKKHKAVRLHGIQGVKSNEETVKQFVPPPMLKQISKRNSVFKSSIRVQDDPLEELEQMLRNQTRKTSILRQESKCISPLQRQTPQDNSGSIQDQSPVTNKHQTTNILTVPGQNNKFNFILDNLQRSFNEDDEHQEQNHDKLSVTLSELQSLNDEDIQERLDEFEISFQQEKTQMKSTEEDHHKQKRQIGQVIAKRKRNEQLTEEISKDDEKLKIRLLQSDLIARVKTDDYLNDQIKDVLAAQEYRKQLLEKQKREIQIRDMKVKVTYEPIQEEIIQKTLKKAATQSASTKKIVPLNDDTPQLLVKRNNNRRKTRVITKKMTFEEYVQGFQEDDMKIEEEKVEIIVMIPNDEHYHDQQTYQEYHKIKIEDISIRHGQFTTECSIEEIVEKSPKQYTSCLKAMNYTEDDYYIYLDGCIGVIKNMRRKVFYLVDSKLFAIIMNGSVAINTLIMALDGLVNDESILNDFNYAFTIIFTIELGLKLLGLGLVNYTKDAMNCFDAIIVALSLADIIFFSGGSAFKSVKIFRAFRVLRVTKLMRTLKFMNFLISVLSNAFQSLMYIFLLLLLFMYIFTLLGMSFFGGEINYSSSGIRQNFDTFYASFLVVFQILTLENWNSVLYALMLAPVNNVVVVFYCIVWIFIGNYVLLNLFLASLLDNFEAEYMIENEMLKDSSQKDQNEQSHDKLPHQTEFASQFISHTQTMPIKADFIYYNEPEICLYSLFIFHQSNFIRKFSYRIVKHTVFDNMILVAIVLSSLKLVIDTYITDFLTETDIFFAYFFGAEFLLKIIAFGFVLEPCAYLRDGWNVLDFIIVGVSFVDIYISGIDLSFVKILRLLRTLRPLRFISHNKSMKLLVNTLINSAAGIANVGVVVILAWMMFAILGVNLQKNKMHYCDNGEYNWIHQADCNGRWVNRDMNFDNVFYGMLTLFVISTLEGWPDQMYWFIDADESGPIRDAQTWFSSYFIVYILIGSILLMNLFVGVILVNYKLSEDDSKDKSVSQDQENWISIQKLIIDSNPNFAQYYPPKSEVRAKAFWIISHQYFDPIIMFFIIMNILVMAMTYEGSSTQYQNGLDNLNLAFSCVFITESIFKLVGYGVVGYFRNNWNQFDFFVVLTSILDMILNFSGSNSVSFLKSGPQLARVFRVLRVTRLFRLVKQLQGLKKLIDTAIFSLPALLNVSALMFLLYFIFSILGVFLFQNIKSGSVINSDNNFSNFHMAFLILFRSTTGEDWYKIMYDVMNAQASFYCLYFIIFTIIMQMIMLNLFVLIILNQYEQFYFNNDNPLQRFFEYETDFVEVWAPLASETRGMLIHEKQLVSLLLQIKKPLGYDVELEIQKANQEWRQANINTEQSFESKEKIKTLVTAEGKRLVSKMIMEMGIVSNDEGFLEYHYVLFTFMKNFQKNLMNEVTPEGATKLLKREELTLNKIRKRRNVVDQSVNPCVQLLFVMMCFKAYKRYAIKLRDKRMREQHEFSEKSSDSSYYQKSASLGQRDSASESIESINGSQQKFFNPPDVGVYAGDVNLQFNQDSQNLSHFSEFSEVKKIDVSK